MLTLTDKFIITFYILISMAAMISFVFYVFYLTTDIFPKELPKLYNDVPIYAFISFLGFLIALGPFLLLGAISIMIKIAIILEKDNLKEKKLQKQLTNILTAFLTFSFAMMLFLLILGLSITQKSEIQPT